MKNVIKLKIAEIVIELKSKFAMDPFKKEEDWRFLNFIYSGSNASDIVLEVLIAKELPKIRSNAKRIFLTRHPASGQRNWALFKRNGSFLLRNYVLTKRQHIILNKNYTRGVVFLKADEKKGSNWQIKDIIYDALQIILINYITSRDGMFVHAIGLKDIDKRGLLFLGKSGEGKSTTARLWHKHSQAKVLNDDRIIIRRINGAFLIYGCPWHGDFSDYLISKIEIANLSSIFFLGHGKHNSAQALSAVKAFNLLCPCTFHTFWDRAGLVKAVKFSEQLMKNIPCFKLEFKNNKEVISFVRAIKLRNQRTE